MKSAMESFIITYIPKTNAEANFSKEKEQPDIFYSAALNYVRLFFSSIFYPIKIIIVL